MKCFKIDAVQTICLAPPTKLVHGDRRSSACSAALCVHPPTFTSIAKIIKYILASQGNKSLVNKEINWTSHGETVHPLFLEITGIQKCFFFLEGMKIEDLGQKSSEQKTHNHQQQTNKNRSAMRTCVGLDLLLFHSN